MGIESLFNVVYRVSSLSAGLSGLAKELLSDFADSLPGIDEAKGFMQVMRLVCVSVCVCVCVCGQRGGVYVYIHTCICMCVYVHPSNTVTCCINTSLTQVEE